MTVEARWNRTPAHRWEARCDSAAAPLQQRWAYGQACAQVGTTVDRVEYRRGGKTIGLAQILSRRIGRIMPISLVSGGPVWIDEPDPDDRTQMLRLLRSGPPGFRSRAIVVSPMEDPDNGADCAGYAAIKTAATHARLETACGAAAVRAAGAGPVC